jgi:hypothetical protein
MTIIVLRTSPELIENEIEIHFQLDTKRFLLPALHNDFSEGLFQRLVLG